MIEDNTLTLILTITSCAFDAQHHGVDYWLIQVNTNEMSDIWIDRAAIIFEVIFFMIILFAIEYFRLDLLSSWILFASILITLNFFIYFNPLTKITFF